MICKFYRFIKSRVGCSLKGTHCRRHLVPPGKQVAYQLPRTQGSLSSLKRVPRPINVMYYSYGPTKVVQTRELFFQGCIFLRLKVTNY